MKTILTKSFITDFEKHFKKYSIGHNDLVIKLKKTKIIKLKNPYFKIKTQLNWVELRWIWIFNDEKNLIPIFFVLKKEKIYWENLILNKEVLQKINNLLFSYSKDFQNWDIYCF